MDSEVDVESLHYTIINTKKFANNSTWANYKFCAYALQFLLITEILIRHVLNHDK